MSNLRALSEKCITKQKLVKKLSSFPHRAITGNQRQRIFEILESHVSADGVEFDHQPFHSPHHFMQIMNWLFGGMIICLVASFYLPLSAFVLSAMIAVSAFRYFDWRSSFLTKLPPQIKTYNFRAKRKISNPKHRLVLMAHWDTAPISLPYLPSMISDFRRNLFVLMLFITGVAALCILQLIGLRATWQFYA